MRQLIGRLSLAALCAVCLTVGCSEEPKFKDKKAEGEVAPDSNDASQEMRSPAPPPPPPR